MEALLVEEEAPYQRMMTPDKRPASFEGLISAALTPLPPDSLLNTVAHSSDVILRSFGVSGWQPSAYATPARRARSLQALDSGSIQPASVGCARSSREDPGTYGTSQGGRFSV